MCFKDAGPGAHLALRHVEDLAPRLLTKHAQVIKLPRPRLAEKEPPRVVTRPLDVQEVRLSH